MLGLETMKLLERLGYAVEGCPRPWLCIARRGPGAPVMLPVDWVMHVGLLDRGVVRVVSGPPITGRVVLRDPLTMEPLGEALLSEGRGEARLPGGWMGTWLLVDAGECRAAVEALVRSEASEAGMVYAVLAYSPRRPRRLPRWPPLRAPGECRPPVEAPGGGDPLQG